MRTTKTCSIIFALTEDATILNLKTIQYFVLELYLLSYFQYNYCTKMTTRRSVEHWTHALTALG